MMQAVIMPAFVRELRWVLEWEDEGRVEEVEVSFWEVWLGVLEEEVWISTIENDGDVYLEVCFNMAIVFLCDLV